MIHPIRVPVRTAVSPDAEHTAALARAMDIDAWLMEQGWPAGIRADSGNGGHGAYRIDLPRDDGGLVERCLQALAARFNDAQVTVDTSVHNPARIWKLYGTLAGKGDAAAAAMGRPQRMAKMLNAPEVVEIVPLAKLEALAAMAPKPTVKPSTPAAASGNGNAFDLPEWIRRHNLAVSGPESWKGGERWVFDICPWNSEHTNRSAFSIRQASGALVAGCQHNGCGGKDWHALRDAVEPGWRERRQGNSNPHSKAKHHGQNWQDDSPILYTPKLVNLANVTPKAVEWLWPFRFPLGKLSMVAGEPGLGKSFLSMDMTARITRGMP